MQIRMLVLTDGQLVADANIMNCSGQLKLATALEFSSIGFPIRLGVIHRYSHAALASCNIRRYSL